MLHFFVNIVLSTYSIFLAKNELQLKQWKKTKEIVGSAEALNGKSFVPFSVIASFIMQIHFIFTLLE